MSIYVAVDIPGRTYPVIEYGEGVYVYDKTGKRYLDGISGIHAANIGHGVSEVALAMAEQAGKIAFVNRRLFTNEPQLKLASRIVADAPPGMVRVHFVSSGSEANEAALQLARQYHIVSGYPTKYRIVGRWHSYHGSTVATISMGGHRSHRDRMGKYLIDFPHIHSPHCFRCPHELDHPGCKLLCAEELAQVIEREGADTIAAFIAEPIIGTTGGAIVPPPGYYEMIREICDHFQILFIADEVITGFGRTGRRFGIEHWKTVPDIIACGKGLSCGYVPLSAVIIHERVWEALCNQPHCKIPLRSTFSGNPVSCAAALEAQRYILRHNLVERCEYVGKHLKHQLERLAERSPIMGEVRGRGLLLAVEFVQNQKTRSPFPRSVCFQEQVVESALERGLILIGGTGTDTRTTGDHILITPPFIISKEECDEMAAILEESISEAYSRILHG